MSGPGRTLVEAISVRVRRGGREILRGLDLAVRTGEVVVLLGPNGAGKSTLLAAVSGDEEPDAGQVLLDGRPARSWRPRDAARRRAVLPQSNPLSFPFRVREVVEMGRAPWRGRASAGQDAAAVRRAMTATDVADLAERSYPSLSGGEAARVSLARVLAQDSPLLLLDEPTAALDAHHQEAVFDVLRERTRAGAGVLAVVHDLNLAAAYADRVAVLTDGRIVADGPPADVLRDDLLSTAYRHPMEVVAHPGSGLPTVMPRRRPAGATGDELQDARMRRSDPGTDVPLARLLLLASRWFDTRSRVLLAERGWPPLSAAQTLLFAQLLPGRITVSELARRLGNSRQATHEMVGALVDLGFPELVEDPGHRGRRLVCLTGRGNDLVADSYTVLHDLESTLDVGSTGALRRALTDLRLDDTGRL